MSKDLSTAKKPIGSIYPEKAYDSTGLDRIEEFLTPALLRSRFFLGIPLYLKLTKEKIEDIILLDYIKRAANLVENDTKIEVSPTIKRTKQPFDPSMYAEYLYTEVPFKPVQKMIRMAICAASYTGDSDPNTGENSQYPSGGNIYQIPNDWIDMSNANRGRINVIPLQSAFSGIGISISAPASGAAILALIGMQGWTPAYWVLEYLTGYVTEDGRCPIIINELVGRKAALLLLDHLILQYSVSSQSMGLDGLSQSVGDQMFQLLTKKRDTYNAEYEDMVKKLKFSTNNTFMVTHI